MGVCKRVAGWRRAGLPISRAVRVLVGLEAPTDWEAVEAAREAREIARAAAKEAREERAAIQWEGRPSRPAPPTPGPPERPASIETSSPRRASPGWYQVGPSLYRQGEGPYPTFGVPPEPKPPATAQGRLFD